MQTVGGKRPEHIQIRPQEDGNYEVSEVLGNEVVRQFVNLDGINQLLSPFGYAVDGGQLAVKAPRGAAVLPSGGAFADGAPNLPDVAGDQFPPDVMLRQLKAYGTELGEMSLLWAALSTLATIAMRERQEAADRQHAMEELKQSLKSQEILATEKQIEADIAAAWQNFAFTAAGAAAAGVTMKTLGQSMFASTLSGILSQTSNSLGGAVVKTFGAGRESDEQRLKAMRYQQWQEAVEQMAQEFRTSAEANKEALQQTLRQLQQVMERATQAMQKISQLA